MRSLRSAYASMRRRCRRGTSWPRCAAAGGRGAMRPAKFDYAAPASVAEAAALLAESDGAGRILAGGQSLLPAMNLRLARPSCLIDLRRIPGLEEIAVAD